MEDGVVAGCCLIAYARGMVVGRMEVDVGVEDRMVSFSVRNDSRVTR